MILVRNGYQMRDIAGALRTRGLPYRTRSKSAIQLSHVRGIVAWERRRKGDASAEDEALEFADRKAPPGAIWFDALTGIPRNQRDYYRSILRAGYRLQEAPKILLSTIHGVKGQEADHVVLHTDLTRKIVEQMGDGEHRVFYVGATRARHSLTIVAPENAALGYSI
jgi:superfamily I DNA/RNA helicase